MPSTDIAAQAGTDRGYHHKGSMEPEQATNMWLQGSRPAGNVDASAPAPT